MTDPPTLLVNEDARLIAIRSDQATSPAAAFRKWLDHEPFLIEDETAYDENKDRYFLPLSVYRALRNQITPKHYRKADPSNLDEIMGEFGEDTWWPCGSEVAGAVLYWDLDNG